MRLQRWRRNAPSLRLSSRASLSINRGTPRTSSRTHISATGCSARLPGQRRHCPAQHSTPARQLRLPGYKKFACPMSRLGRAGDGASPPSNDPANTLDPTCGSHPLIGVYLMVREKMERERATAASGTMTAVGAGSVTSGKESVQSSSTCVFGDGSTVTLMGSLARSMSSSGHERFRHARFNGIRSLSAQV